MTSHSCSLPAISISHKLPYIRSDTGYAPRSPVTCATLRFFRGTLYSPTLGGAFSCVFLEPRDWDTAADVDPAGLDGVHAFISFRHLAAPSRSCYPILGSSGVSSRAGD